jgi:hypothetical protein
MLTSLYASEKDLSYPALNSILSSCEKHKNTFKGKKYYVPGAWTVNPLRGEEDLKKLVSSGDIVNPVPVESPYNLIETTINNIIKYDSKNRLTEKIDLKTGTGAIQ